MTADSIARATLEGVERDAMFVQPLADGRWMWRLKRLAPQTYPRLTGSVAARLLGRRR